MPRIVVLDQVLKSWLFRFLTTKVDVIFILQKPNRFLFQFRFERAIACFCWRSYTLLRDSAGGNTPQAAQGGGNRCRLSTQPARPLRVFFMGTVL